MPNLFVELPTPAGDGAGTAVDVALFDASKSIVCSGNGTAVEPSVTIEFSNELVPVNWAPLYTFDIPGRVVLYVAARWMRAVVQSYRGGGAPEVDVGGTDGGGQFVDLPVPAGNGVGAAVDISLLDAFKTVHVGGAFRGALLVQVSTDLPTEWIEWFSFLEPGDESQSFIGKWARVKRVGVPIVNAGTPSVVVGAAPGGGGGGGAVVTDATLIGDGTAVNPLGVNIPLQGLVAVFGDVVTITGNGTAGSPLSVVAPARPRLPAAVWMGGREANALTTPLIVGAISFNPAEYADATFLFGATAAIGTPGTTGRAVLHSVTDSVQICSFEVTLTAAVRFSQALSIGAAGPNTIPNAARIYEVRIFVDAPAASPIELYSADIRAIPT